MAGATAIQVGTATFRAPETATRIAEELPEALLRRGCTRLADLVGRAHPASTPMAMGEI
jgi:dihydroorotate dehydrogenase (NAD+) catalytic subunit